MKKIAFFTLIFAPLFFVGCSNLFESFVNSDGSSKTGDTSVLEPEVVDPRDVFELEDEEFELKNTEISAGIVVIKNSQPEYNQIVYSKEVTEYEIGYDFDWKNEAALENAEINSSPVYLNGYDDPLVIKVFKNDVHASVEYTAVQTRTTNFAGLNTAESNFIDESNEVFADLPLDSQKPVAFSINREEAGEPIVFDFLPYGTTFVTIKIIADDDFYVDEYKIILNKKHLLTSLVVPEAGNSKKSTLTAGLVALKEGNSYSKNIITYENGTLDYIIGSDDDLQDYLWEEDGLVYVKAIPFSKTASIEWSALQIGRPEYKYEYFKTTTTTVVTTDSDGILVGEPKVTSVNEQVSEEEGKAFDAKKSSPAITVKDGSGNTKITTTVTTTIRKTIVGLEKMEAIEPVQLTDEQFYMPENQTDNQSENQTENQTGNQDAARDRVRAVNLPYGQTKITIKVSQKQENTFAEYSITFNKVKFSVSQDSETSVNVEDETSKLKDLTVESKKFEFEKNKTVYSIIVDEETDEIVIDPILKNNETITNPISKTKNAVLQANSNTVLLLGGLQVITFDVEEEGFEPRTYTIYVYKEIGNTKLASINYKSFTSSDGTEEKGTWTEQKMNVSSYASGLSAMNPSSVKNCNGGTVQSPVLYTLYARADAAVDVTKMSFNIIPQDTHTTVSYFVGENCPAENQNAENNLWSDQSPVFNLNNESSGDEAYAKTYLWVRTKSRPYYHEPVTEEKELSSYGKDLYYSDVTYHKIEINKPGSANSKINYLKAVKLAEGKSYDETAAQENVYTYESSKDVTFAVDSNIASKEIATDYDIVKINFRLADKSEETSDGPSKKVTYSAENVRSSDTCGSPNTKFTGYAKDSDSGRLELTPDENGIYTIILGESDVEQNTEQGILYSVKDFPMGTTTVKIYVKGNLSETLVYTKPDLDTFEIDNTPSSLVGGAGTYKYKNGIFYINNSVETISLNVKMHQKNQSLYVSKYEQTAGINGAEISGNSNLDAANVTSAQNGTTKEWNSTISAIPVGTSVVTYGVSSALAQNDSESSLKNDQAFKVTIVRAADSESRLRTFTINQFAFDDEGNYAEKPEEVFKQGLGFNWNNGGAFARENADGTKIYYNIYEKTIPTAKYTALLETVSADAEIQSELYATNAFNPGSQSIINALAAGSESELFVNPLENENNAELAENKWLLLENASPVAAENYKSAELGRADEWIINGSEYKYYLVHGKVTSGAGDFIHHYYLLLSVELDDELELTASVNQFANKTASAADDDGDLMEGDIETSDPQIIDGKEITNTASEFVTNLNRTGKIVISPNKNFSASWYKASENESFASVSLYNLQSNTESELSSAYYSENPSDHRIELSNEIYSDEDILGNEIHVKYGIISQNGNKIIYHTYKILISTLQTVTEYSRWTRSNSYSYVLPQTGNENQIAFRFGSKITDENHPAKNIEHGGIDVIATKNNGTNWGTTSYNFSGLHYVLLSGNEMYLAKLEADTENSTDAVATAFYKIYLENNVYTVNSQSLTPHELGANLYVQAFVKYDGKTPYLSIAARVNSADSANVTKLGVLMDTLVADDSKATDSKADSVEIIETNNGFEMAGDGYKFNVLLKNALGVDDVDGFWYGDYVNGVNYSYFTNLFDSDSVCSSSTNDSALSFFWNLDQNNCTKTIRLSVE